MLQQINTENFQQMLSQFSTTELEGMIEKFPYFEQAHLLLAKKYQQENSSKFDQQLQLAALYIQDRELLYNLFNEKSVVISSAVETIEIIAPQEEEKVAVEPVKLIEQDEVPQEIVLKQEIVEPLETKIEVAETQDVSTDESIALALAEIKETAEAIQQISEDAKTEGPIQIVPVVDAVVEQEAKEISLATEISVEENPAISLELPQAEIEEEQEASIVTPDVEETVEAAQQETIEEIQEVDEKPLKTFSRIEPHTFDEWLVAFNNKTVSSKTEKTVVRVEEPATDEELTQLIAQNITVDYLHGLVKEETQYAKGLERFIEEQIQKHKQPEIIKKSSENMPDTDLITETMAKVYEMQKKYAKAIKVYEALTLKFPEKSSLFAARINFLKNSL